MARTSARLFLAGVAVALLAGCGRGPALDPAEAEAAAEIGSLGGAIQTEVRGDVRTVVTVDLRKTAINDEDLGHLARLPNVRKLRLGRTEVTDAGLEKLAGLTHLRELYLGRTKVTDKGLVHLQGLTELEWLAVNRTAATDAGFKRLQKALPNLKRAR